MASLTHICIFTEHGWERITAAEATGLPFDAGSSARGRLFMCELCGQYVTLTREGRQVRHFRHRAKEADKTCPERTFGVGADTGCSCAEHDLPIRLRLLPTGFPSDFELELGLFGIPAAALKRLKDPVIRIKSIQGCESPSVYSLKDQLSQDPITYVSIGQIPFPEYQIETNFRNALPLSFWPERIRGVDPTGTLFDVASRKKLPYDADVQVGKHYYLLQTNSKNPAYGCASVSSNLLFRKAVPGQYWYLYEVFARVLDDAAAEFFLQLHCRLTDRPFSVQPIWPIYTKSPYVIHHNCQRAREMVFHIRGDVTTKCFPSAVHFWEALNGQGRIEYVRCGIRQQLISAGHAYKLGTDGRDFWRRLKYTYLWKEPLDRTTEQPVVSVTDITGQAVPPGLTEQLPPKKILRISAPYDGLVILKQNGRIVEQRRLKADAVSEFDSIQFDCALEILQGLDCVWSIQYQRKTSGIPQEEARLLRRLEQATGPQVLVPHTWGAAAERLADYPQIKRWLYQRIREGHMPVQAQREFQCFIEKLGTK